MTESGVIWCQETEARSCCVCTEEACVNRKWGQIIKLQGLLAMTYFPQWGFTYEALRRLSNMHTSWGPRFQTGESMGTFHLLKHIAWLHCSLGSEHAACSLFTTHAVTPCDSNKYHWEHTVFHLRLFYDYESQCLTVHAVCCSHRNTIVQLQ